MSFESLSAFLIIILINIIVLLLVCFIGIKLAKIRKLNVIYIRQYFISMLSTLAIALFCPTILAVPIFILLYFLYRGVIFKKDTVEIQKIYSLHNGDVNLAPPIQKLSWALLYKHEENDGGAVDKEYCYSLSQYLNNSIYIFIFYCIKNTSNPENTVLYAIEFFVAMTALFIVIGKVIYRLSLATPSSLFFLCPTGSYIPVVIAGVLFYFLTIVIFIHTV